MKDVIIAVLSLLVIVLFVLLFQARSTYSPSPSDDSKVTGVLEMLKMNKTTLEIVESLKVSGVPDNQVGTIISLAQARWRDEMRAQGVEVETPK